MSNKAEAVCWPGGVVFQEVLPSIIGNAGVARQSLTIESNNTNGDNCWVHVGEDVPNTRNSSLLLPGGSYARYWPHVPSDAVQAACGSAGDSIYVETQ